MKKIRRVILAYLTMGHPYAECQETDDFIHLLPDHSKQVLNILTEVLEKKKFGHNRRQAAYYTFCRYFAFMGNPPRSWYYLLDGWIAGDVIEIESGNMRLSEFRDKFFRELAVKIKDPKFPFRIFKIFKLREVSIGDFEPPGTQTQKIETLTRKGHCAYYFLERNFGETD